MKITKAQLKQIIKEEISSLIETYESKMSCEMKGGTWHRKTGDGPGEGECSFGDVADRPHLEEEIDENIAPPLIAPDYDEVDHETYRTKLRGKMAPFSQEELQALLPNERIADPMNPSTFNQPGAFIPLGKTDLFVYFKTSDGPILRMAIGDKV